MVPYARGDHHAGVPVGRGGSLAAPRDAAHWADAGPAVPGSAEALDARLPDGKI